MIYKRKEKPHISQVFNASGGQQKSPELSIKYASAESFFYARLLLKKGKERSKYFKDSKPNKNIIKQILTLIQHFKLNIYKSVFRDTNK